MIHINEWLGNDNLYPNGYIPDFNFERIYTRINQGVKHALHLINQKVSELALRIFEVVANKLSVFLPNLRGLRTKDKNLETVQIDNDITVAIQMHLIGKTCSTAIYAHKTVLETLTQLFGPRISHEIIKFYELTNSEFISSTSLHALLIGIQANLTLEDLKYLHSHPNTTLQLFPPLNPSIFNRNFSSLSQDELYHFLDDIRCILLCPENYEHEPYAVQLKKDINFLNTCAIVNIYDPASSDDCPTKDFKSFGYAEFMAKYIVYNLFTPSTHGFEFSGLWYETCTAKFSKGTLFPVYDSRLSKKPLLMEAHGNFHNDGLYAINVIPAKPVNHPNFGFMGATVFRGTHDWKSAVRDFHPSEKIGRKSFEEAQNMLLSAVERDINELRKKTNLSNSSTIPLTWDITGHSLGAVDAQRMTVAFSKNLPKDTLEIRNVNLWTFNTPRIEKDENLAFLYSADKSTAIPFNIYHARSSGDFIQKFGEVLLGNHSSTEELPSNVKVTIVTFDHPEEYSGPSVKHNITFVSNGIIDDESNEIKPNPTWITHVATNDSEFNNRCYGKNLELKISVCQKSLFNRINGKYGPNFASPTLINLQRKISSLISKLFSRFIPNAV